MATVTTPRATGCAGVIGLIPLVIAATFPLVAACGSPDDITGPFTGVTHRYVLDGLALPMSNTEARELGGDLSGDGTVDNQLGMVISTLAREGDVTQHGFDMIAGGAITTSLEITADNLRDDPSVGVRYLGTPMSPSVELGGRFVDGWFRSNLTAESSVAGAADIHLPVFVEADPSLVAVIGMELVLVPDGDGGFNASVHAAIPGQPSRQVQEAMHRGFVQMIASEPSAHRAVMNLLDTNRDGTVAFEEVAYNALIVSLLAPDITLDAEPVLSIGFRAHFRACESGSCLEGAAFDPCFDRVRDGDETDVDCGGSCRRCESAATCISAEDCESNVCEQARCGPASCFDGARDGLESDVDCGANCTPCELGRRCYFWSDCLSRQCGMPGDDSWDFSSDICYPAAP